MTDCTNCERLRERLEAKDALIKVLKENITHLNDSLKMWRDLRFGEFRHLQLTDARGRDSVRVSANEGEVVETQGGVR